MDFSAKILAKFREKFLERPPTNLCSPNTKCNFWSKFWQSSKKNSSNNLLSTYVFLIQSEIFDQKFLVIDVSALYLDNIS